MPPDVQLDLSGAAGKLEVAQKQFGNILLKTQEDGSQVYLRDVGRVEKGAETYSTVSRYNGKPAAGLGIKLASGANALDTANAVKAKMAELQRYFPPGMEVVYLGMYQTPEGIIGVATPGQETVKPGQTTNYSLYCICGSVSTVASATVFVNNRAYELWCGLSIRASD